VSAKNMIQGLVTFPAATDLSSYQYCFVNLETDGQVGMASATEAIIGVLQDDPDAENEAASVCVYGISKLVVDGNAGAIACGDKLAADSAGKGVKTTTDLDDYGAIALEASTAAGDIISVLVVPGGLISAS